MEPTKLIVTGAGGLIGAEVCRLTVALGHDVVGVDRRGRPELDEPWTYGVQWVEQDVFDVGGWAGHLDGCEALVHCIRGVDERGGDAALVAWERARAAGLRKFVMIAAESELSALAAGLSGAEARVAEGELRHAILRAGVVWGPGRTMSAAIAGHEGATAQRVERVAMCALRAALEDQISGILEIEQIEHLGDAMMIQ